jgi:hypothetical protein
MKNGNFTRREFVLPVELAADKTARNAWLFLLLEPIESNLRGINTRPTQFLRV